MDVSVREGDTCCCGKIDRFRSCYFSVDSELELRTKFEDAGDGEAVEEGGGSVAEGCVVGRVDGGCERKLGGERSVDVKI